MDCPRCGTAMIAFPVPPDVRDVALGEEVAAICPRCLTLAAADSVDLAASAESVEPADSAGPDADFSGIIESFPEGETGAVMAVAVGLLVESLALNRRTVADLLERVQDDGVDPWLVLERLAIAPTVESDADLERARIQLEQLLDR